MPRSGIAACVLLAGLWSQPAIGAPRVDLERPFTTTWSKPQLQVTGSLGWSFVSGYRYLHNGIPLAGTSLALLFPNLTVGVRVNFAGERYNALGFFGAEVGPALNLGRVRLQLSGLLGAHLVGISVNPFLYDFFGVAWYWTPAAGALASAQLCAGRWGPLVVTAIFSIIYQHTFGVPALPYKVYDTLPIDEVGIAGFNVGFGGIF